MFKFFALFAAALGWLIEWSGATDGTSGNYLRRTVASGISTFTFSGWIKQNVAGSNDYFFAITNSGGGSRTSFGFNASNQFIIYNNFLGGTLTSTETFTTTTDFMHILLSCSGSAMTVKINGVTLTMTGTTIAPFLAGNYFHIGSYSTVSNFWDGQYAEIYFIDGQALDADDFGENRGGWKPKEYEGTYGTEGFYLAEDLATGVDVSGNANHLVKTGTVTKTAISPAIGT